MENTEAGDTQQDETTESVHHLQQVGQQDLDIVEKPVGQESAEHDDGTVNQKDAPIRQ